MDKMTSERLKMSIGKNKWAIAEGYIPPDDKHKDKTMISHESACILNANEKQANVYLTIYYADRDPVGPYHITVPARRTMHIRFNELEKPERIPPGTDYSSVFESDLPIVVQHTRLDGRTSQNALLSTTAYGE